MKDGNSTGHPSHPGELLRQWIEAQGFTVHGWALANGLDPSEMSKLVRGVRKTVTVKTGKKIEEATEGAFPVDTWV